jgi:hypothetical protein
VPRLSCLDDLGQAVSPVDESDLSRGNQDLTAYPTCGQARSNVAIQLQDDYFA